MNFSISSNYLNKHTHFEKLFSDTFFTSIELCEDHINKNIIDNLILKNNLEGKIDNLKISFVDTLIYVSFSSSNINDAVSVSEKLINGSLNEISSIRYQRSNNKINTQLIFN